MFLFGNGPSLRVCVLYSSLTPVNCINARTQTLDKNSFNDLLNDVRITQLFAGGVSQQETLLFIENFHLAVSLRLLKAQVLEKKLHGLDAFAEACQRVERQSFAAVLGGGGGSQGSSSSSTKLEASFLIQWMDEKKIVEIAIGEGAHHSMISRTVPILKFLAQQKALTVAHINLLWKAG